MMGMPCRAPNMCVHRRIQTHRILGKAVMCEPTLFNNIHCWSITSLCLILMSNFANNTLTQYWRCILSFVINSWLAMCQKFCFWNSQCAAQKVQLFYAHLWNCTTKNKHYPQTTNITHVTQAGRHQRKHQHRKTPNHFHVLAIAS